jgi:ABC-2 type transport system permease protein
MPGRRRHGGQVLYWQVARRAFRRYLKFIGATVGGVFTNTVFGFFRAYVFIAVFSSVAGSIGGFDLRETLTYIFITQGILMAIYIWGWCDIALSIRSGDVVTDLFRPFDYQLYWLAQDVGRAAYHLLFRGIPPFIIGALFFDLIVPIDPLIWLAFVVSVIGAVVVSFALRFLMNLSAFWLLDYRGVLALGAAVWTFMSGFAVPVSFFPSGLRAVADALPFAATVQIPVEVFLGKVRGADLLAALAFQFSWAIALLMAGRAVLKRATRRLVVQGG